MYFLSAFGLYIEYIQEEEQQTLLVSLGCEIGTPSDSAARRRSMTGFQGRHISISPHFDIKINQKSSDGPVFSKDVPPLTDFTNSLDLPCLFLL